MSAPSDALKITQQAHTHILMYRMVIESDLHATNFT